ncbi:MAG: hypothetical protein J6C82_02320 [Clostridia bacterium]|nr:hypothetical protein [Clostridia bacterium]
MFKKLFAGLCAVVLWTACLPQAYADVAIASVERRFTGNMIKDAEVAEVEKEGLGGTIYRVASQSGKTLEQLLKDGMRAHDEVVDLSSLKMANTSANRTLLGDTVCKVLYENYDILAVTLYDRETENGYITGIAPYYLFDSVEEDKAAIAEMQEKIEYYKSLSEDVPEDDGKLLIIHDALARDSIYAPDELVDSFEAKYEIYDEHGKDNVPEESRFTSEELAMFSAYGMLINQKAVCQGNSIALAAICEEIGIEASFCSSDKMEHIWNIIKLNGEWYHVDETWNDPTVSLGGVLQTGSFHNYFLVSDDTLRTLGHDADDWVFWADDANVVCTDTTYESGHIINGDYVYEGVNYGGWYGLVSYEDGRYRTDIYANMYYYENTSQGVEAGIYLLFGMFGQPFYSNSIISPGAMATELHEMTLTSSSGTSTVYDVIILFANDDFKGSVDCIGAVYGEDCFERCSINEEVFGAVESGDYAMLTLPKGRAYPMKMFFWYADTQQPVCETRTLP